MTFQMIVMGLVLNLFGLEWPETNKDQEDASSQGNKKWTHRL